MSLTEFYDLLEGHDWYYEYSDDYSVWSAGHKKQKAIELIAIQNKGRYKLLYDAYSTHIFNHTDKPPRPKE